MDNSWKNFIHNAFGLLNFGYGLFKRGACDKRIEGEYRLVENCEIKGYTKKEASELLNMSVRQFDRRIAKGLIRKGRKYRGDSKLYWDKGYIGNLTRLSKM